MFMSERHRYTAAQSEVDAAVAILARQLSPNGEASDAAERAKAAISAEPRANPVSEEELAVRDEQLMLLAKTRPMQCSASRSTVIAFTPRRRRAICSGSIINCSSAPNYSIVSTDDTPEVLAAFKSLAAGDIGDCIIAYRSEILHEPGSYCWLEAHCGLVRMDVDVPSEIIASIRDVSPTKALEEDCRKATTSAIGAGNCAIDEQLA